MRNHLHFYCKTRLNFSANTVCVRTLGSWTALCLWPSRGHLCCFTTKCTLASFVHCFISVYSTAKQWNKWLEFCQPRFKKAKSRALHHQAVILQGQHSFHFVFKVRIVKNRSGRSDFALKQVAIYRIESFEPLQNTSCFDKFMETRGKMLHTVLS